TIAGETTISSSDVPAAEISSPTAARPVRPSPPPPYSSGRLMPRYPREASASHSSRGGSSASTFSRMYSGPKPEQIEETVSRSMISSSEGTSGSTGIAEVEAIRLGRKAKPRWGPSRPSGRCARPELVAHARELLGDLPQAPTDVLVAGVPTRPDGLRMPAL